MQNETRQSMGRKMINDCGTLKARDAGADVHKYGPEATYRETEKAGAQVSNSVVQQSGGSHFFIHSAYQPGQRMRFEINGCAMSGTVDVATDDDSAIWVWLDNGAGRMMLFPGEATGTIAESMACEPDEAGVDGATNGPKSCWCWQASRIYGAPLD